MRKTVTALFCDLTGSTRLGRRLDAEAMRGVIERYFSAVSAVVSRHGGTVDKFVGDAVMAVFGVPAAHEDDALRACRAAVDILAAVEAVDREVQATHGERLLVRLGIETGEAVVGDPARGSTFTTGLGVNTAARLEQIAGPGECLIGPGCHRLVRARVDVESRPGLLLKGIDEPVHAYRLLGVRDLVGDRPASAPMIGRSRELALLRLAFDRAVAHGTLALVTVLGPAGMGKSRLAAELVSNVEHESTVLRGRCLSYGEGVTYWPLVEAVRQAAGLSGSETVPSAHDALAKLLGDLPDASDVVERIAPLAGLGGAPGPPEDTAWAVSTLLSAMSSDRPVVFVIDDLHWAEPGFVALLEAVCARRRAGPVLVAVFARPELLDDHPDWGAGVDAAITAALEPLVDAEVAGLAAALLGGAIPDGAVAQLLEAAGGNPLFVEQLVMMLVEDGVLLTDGDGWVLAGDLTSLSVPPTISAVLAARLDRLSAQERALLGAASVMGQVFYPAAVAALSTVPMDMVSAQLTSLVRTGLVCPVRSDLPGQDALQFGHVLIHDASYGRLRKAVRADLHEKFARWLDTKNYGQPVDDFVGSHLEAAYLLRAELGAIDDAACRVGRAAADRLAAAADSLVFVDDRAAIGLFERAERLRTDDGPQRWTRQIDLASAWSRTGSNLSGAVDLARSVRSAAEEAGDPIWSALAGILEGQVRLLTHPAGSLAALRQAAHEGLRVFSAADHHIGLSVAHEALADVANVGARHADSAREFELAGAHAELAGRYRAARFHQQEVLSALMFGDCPAADGLVACRRALEAADHRTARVIPASYLGWFAALLGREGEARDARELAERVAGEVGGTLHQLVTYVRACAEVDVENWPEAARLLDQVCRETEASGDQGRLSTDAAMHALALLHLGRVDAARAQVGLALRSGSAEDVMTHALANAASAWLAALDGDRAAAELHTDRGTTLLPREVLSNRATIHVACAEAATVLGDRSHARQHRLTAIDLYRTKGNVVGAARQLGLL